MNRKQEDALVRLAFGDTSPEEASTLERQASGDPDASATLATYRRMREGLKDLHDIPADQLSKERLRDAILSGGLKPKPVQTQRSWLWMPALAAVLAFGITIARQNASSPAGPVALPNLLMPSAKGPVAMNVPLPPLTRPIHFGSNLGAPVVRGNVVGRTASRSFPRRHAKRQDPVVPENPGMSASQADDLFTYIMPDTSHDDAAPAANAAAAHETKDAIIIIGPQKDGDTGAATATEVKNPTHVVTSG
jgi:hypothetical protein